MADWLRFFRRGRGEEKMSSLELFREIYGGRLSKSGKAVSTQTALEVSTVLACARVIAEGIAQPPLKLFQESKDGKSRLPAKDHPLYRVLHRRPNPWQTSFEYRETLAFHAVLAGNHFSFTNRLRGEVRELIPFEPGTVTVKQEADRTLKYKVRAPSGSEQEFPAEAIWHVRGPSWNSWMGLEAVQLARDAIGLSMATEESQSSLHKNGLRPSGLYSVEGKLEDKQFKDLKTWIDKEKAGSHNTGSWMIMDRGATFTSLEQKGVDAQHLETRRYQVEEICRFFRVMPIMVGYSDKAATYASAEQMFLAHVVHTMSPWWERLEESIDVNLLTEKDAEQGIYSKFIEEGLLRGAAKDTAEVLDGYVNGGIMTPNEARAKLDLNPDSDPASDKLRVPANIVGKQPAKPEPATQE